MKLIELYIEEVKKRLPEKKRHEVELELRSKIGAMLPEDYSEQDAKNILSELGHPAVLASGYADRPMHLIGPRYYDLYLQLLKLILPIAITVTTIIVLIVTIVSGAGEEPVFVIIGDLMGGIISGIINTVIQAVFWLTLVLAVVERAEHSKSQRPLALNFEEWTPDDLRESQERPHVSKEKKIPKSQIFGSLIWAAIWTTVYFNADKLLGIYQEGQRGGLEFTTPIFNQEVLVSYWPLIILVVVMEITLAVYQWRALQWTNKLALFNTFVQLTSVLIFVLIFTNSNLINQAFRQGLEDVFGGLSALNWLIGSVVVIVIISSAVDAIQGIRKARI
ncbi:hypothetical protein A1A1_13242 [Planococcus antarcticus DSM 14505]|uniref:Uncharacterized protein n=1 Tax=Planococcus antarcticus DSM 14505 TaxID=1185653 RepID=A0A1C7DDC2_9BACL|nr:hypothetical protein [Planococcus antarcticus]ANU09445.1 hypothetical protein BBH88_03525 [Planococcus antarcticus DSM 14505]EIM06077.1 hypothetical protein A1A1_13242 [Planococcus antarcticus DSM 14505]